MRALEVKELLRLTPLVAFLAFKGGKFYYQEYLRLQAYGATQNALKCMSCKASC